MAPPASTAPAPLRPTTAPTPAEAVLGRDAAAAWARDGFHIARQVFTPAEVAGLLDAFMGLAQGGPVAGLSDVPPGTAADDPLARWPRILHPHRHPHLPAGALALRTLLDPRLRRLLEALSGRPMLAAQSMVYFKPPGARGQALHQDDFYLKTAPGRCLAAWVALDPADTGNGGLQVVPGSQREPIHCPQTADLSRSIASEYVAPPPGATVVPTTLAAGDVLFFDGAVIHGSEPNRSADRFRRSFICHYVPADSRQVGAWYSTIDWDGRPAQVPQVAQGGPCGSGGSLEAGPH